MWCHLPRRGERHHRHVGGVPSGSRTRVASDDEARRLINACRADFRAPVTAALLTGCRYGELAAMTVDDFNPDVGTLRVRSSKSGKSRHFLEIFSSTEKIGRLCRGQPDIRAAWDTTSAVALHSSGNDIFLIWDQAVGRPARAMYRQWVVLPH